MMLFLCDDDRSTVEFCFGVKTAFIVWTKDIFDELFCVSALTKIVHYCVIIITVL